MDDDAIKMLSDRAQKLRDSLATEEATKNALIMPFIQALGYDVFNPHEVVPEFVADIAGKKGEKVDYAIMQDGKPIMIIECKTCGTPLEAEKRDQLHRYFLTLDSSIGILTDGIRYLFYSRSDDGKNMDTRPFMDFNLNNVDKTLVPELRKLCKGKFDLKATLETVSELRFNRHIKSLLETNVNEPDDDFLKYFIRKAELSATQKTLEQFSGYVKRGFSEFLNEQVNARLKTALNANQKKEEPVKAILIGTVDTNRVFLRNASGIGRSFVILDDTIRKPLVRLFFDKPEKWNIAIVGKSKETVSFDIKSVDDIYAHSEPIRSAAKSYEEKT